eukprot:8429169-Prorocentrum_lima.AAC.1
MLYSIPCILCTSVLLPCNEEHCIVGYSNCLPRGAKKYGVHLYAENRGHLAQGCSPVTPYFGGTAHWSFVVEVHYENNATLHSKDSYIVVPPTSAVVTALWILGEHGASLPYAISGYTIPWDKHQELVPQELARARGEELQGIFQIQCEKLQQMPELGYTVDASTD